MERRIHTVIFDMDGTLSDSSILTMTALRSIAPEQGLPVPSEEAIRKATGYPNPEFYYILFPDTDRSKVNAVGKLVEQEEQRLLPSLGDKLLFSGCQELLVRLREYGMRLCIASTGAEEHVFPILNTTGIIGFFDTISCGRTDKTEMIREMIEPGEADHCLMVGDMKKDSEGARANHIQSVGACFGYCRREDTDFDMYINTPLDLLNIL